VPMTILLNWHVFHAHHPLQFWFPWLLVLPFIAAGGAAWSRRQGGTAREAALVALSPAIMVLGLLVASTLMDLIVDVGGGRHAAEHTFCGSAWALVSFVLAPGTALALGLLVEGGVSGPGAGCQVLHRRIGDGADRCFDRTCCLLGRPGTGGATGQMRRVAIRRLNRRSCRLMLAGHVPGRSTGNEM
jgi:hypothetical protein